MNKKSFESELEWFNKKKQDIESKAKESISELAKEYAIDANKAGYVYNEKTQSFDLDIVPVMEVILSCQGRDKYPSPKVLVHRVNALDEKEFKKYTSAFKDTVPGVIFSLDARNKVLEITKDIAKANTDFFNAFSTCFRQCTINGNIQSDILAEEGLDIFKYPRLFARDSKVSSFQPNYNVIDYYGGFEYFLRNIQCEIHFYTLAKTSFMSMPVAPCIYADHTAFVRVKENQVIKLNKPAL